MIFCCVFWFELIILQWEDHCNSTNGRSKALFNAVRRDTSSDGNFDDFFSYL